MSPDCQSVQDIWDAAQELLSFIEGMDYDALDADRRTQVAILYEISSLAKQPIAFLMSFVPLTLTFHGKR